MNPKPWTAYWGAASLVLVAAALVLAGVGLMNVQDTSLPLRLFPFLGSVAMLGLAGSLFLELTRKAPAEPEDWVTVRERLERRTTEIERLLPPDFSALPADVRRMLAMLHATLMAESRAAITSAVSDMSGQIRRDIGVVQGTINSLENALARLQLDSNTTARREDLQSSIGKLSSVIESLQRKIETLLNRPIGGVATRDMELPLTPGPLPDEKLTGAGPLVHPQAGGPTGLVTLPEEYDEQQVWSAMKRLELMVTRLKSSCERKQPQSAARMATFWYAGAITVPTTLFSISALDSEWSRWGPILPHMERVLELAAGGLEAEVTSQGEVLRLDGPADAFPLARDIWQKTLEDLATNPDCLQPQALGQWLHQGNAQVGLLQAKLEAEPASPPILASLKVLEALHPAETDVHLAFTWIIVCRALVRYVQEPHNAEELAQNGEP